MTGLNLDVRVSAAASRLVRRRLGDLRPALRVAADELQQAQQDRFRQVRFAPLNPSTAARKARAGPVDPSAGGR